MIPFCGLTAFNLNNLHLKNYACRVELMVFFLFFCIFAENTNERQLIPAKILYKWPFRNTLEFVYGWSKFSSEVIFPRVRHVKNGPL